MMYACFFGEEKKRSVGHLQDQFGIRGNVPWETTVAKMMVSCLVLIKLLSDDTRRLGEVVCECECNV